MKVVALLGHAMGAARPLLLGMDPEKAHGLTIAALKLLPPLPSAADNPLLATTVSGLHFPNPVGLAAGFDKHAEVPDALLGLGFGFVEIGTVTPRPQPGNPRPRLFRLPEDGAVINRFGFNSEGHAGVLARLSERAGRSGIVGVNIGANKDTVDKAADYVAGIAAFSRVASYFTVNVSSPNTPGLRDLQAGALLDDLLARVMEARDVQPRRVPVLLKIAPDLDENDLDSIVGCLRRRAVDGLIISNTTVARPLPPGRAHAQEAGGLSGRPLFGPSTRLLAQAALRLEGSCPLVGAGGVHSPETALAKIEAGASLIQLYTGLVYEGPALVQRILAGLEAAIKAAGAPGIAALVGRRTSAIARGDQA